MVVSNTIYFADCFFEAHLYDNFVEGVLIIQVGFRRDSRWDLVLWAHVTLYVTILTNHHSNAYFSLQVKFVVR